MLVLGPAHAGLAIGYVAPGGEQALGKHNAAGLAFTRTQGAVTVLRPDASGVWRDADNRFRAPDEFDALWYHQGDDPGITLGETVIADLLMYVKTGGAMLLSGAAGRLVNDMGVEPTLLRILGTSIDAFVSGIVVQERFRAHPAFAGLDTSQPILLSGRGCNALVDFYGTRGWPRGDLLADGNAGVGERPLVEYTVGAGRIILVGWRLADLTTQDAYRANIERLFGNLLKYLADHRGHRARPIPPAGEPAYIRLLGIPFLRAKAPVDFDVPAAGAPCAAVLGTEAGSGTDYPAGDLHIEEAPVQEDHVKVNALGLTLFSSEKGVNQSVGVLRAEQDAMDRHDRELMEGMKVITPQVNFKDAPLQPSQPIQADRSVLLGRSPFMAPDDGWGGVAQATYVPVETGGFSILDSQRQLNRPIVHGQNRVWTGDVPIFRMDTVTGNGSYAEERVFPLWPRPDAQAGNVNPCMGTLRIGVRQPDGATLWFDTMRHVSALFRPGFSQYELAPPDNEWRTVVTVAPALNGHGMICHVVCDRPVNLVWEFGGVWWSQAESNANRVDLSGRAARITEPNLPNNLVIAGCDYDAQGRVLTAPYGQQVEFAAAAPCQNGYIVAVWGVTAYNEPRAQNTLARLDTPNAAGWPQARNRLKRLWFDCYIGRALDPERRFAELVGRPSAALHETLSWWTKRRDEFQIRTPDPYLNALINWSRCTTEYHRQGPGLVLGAQIWQMYSHISTGWYGKEWGGDHEAIADMLRFYGAMQGDDGFIRWISPSLVAFVAENNTAYWVDQVWRHYTWTGDREFVKDLWPAVRKAVAFQQAKHDPDGDGLFQDFYEYWNCDSNGKGPKAAASSATSWAMLDRAARLAEVVGDGAAAAEYRTAADKTREQIFRELWREEEGRLGSIGADGIWRGHPQTWEEYLAVNAGLLSPEQGRRAMRWVMAHYGFKPYEAQLLACSDWWPIRWSVQWVPSGDTCLAALAGMKSGDADAWWPYLKTAVYSSFYSDFPGINMGISNQGAGGGDREDVDSVDPFTHVAVRGLFGIEPALHENRIDICPSFPSEWTEAGITMPDIRYTYRRDGDKAAFTIHTPRPLVKRVRANLTGPEVVTPAETESEVTVPLGLPIPPPESAKESPILVDRPTKVPQPTVKPLPPETRDRMALVDLSAAFNTTIENMVAQGYIYDYADTPAPIEGWWGNPKITLPPSPRMIEAPNGVRFLTAGRPLADLAPRPNNLLALSSWRPYPLPAGATIPVGLHCEQLWLLLQSYVHPMKNYIPNGEVILHYADGKQSVVSLVPPYNLDCYFQHFSQAGISVPFGQLSFTSGWSFVHQGLSAAHADALAVDCDPGTILESVELRATCSEGVLGLLAVTAVAARRS
jgi:hypothetical protein